MSWADKRTAGGLNLNTHLRPPSPAPPRALGQRCSGKPIEPTSLPAQSCTRGKGPKWGGIGDRITLGSRSGLGDLGRLGSDPGGSHGGGLADLGSLSEIPGSRVRRKPQCSSRTGAKYHLAGNFGRQDDTSTTVARRLIHRLQAPYIAPARTAPDDYYPRRPRPPDSASLLPPLHTVRRRPRGCGVPPAVARDGARPARRTEEHQKQ
jgi:hypothetical protein